MPRKSCYFVYIDGDKDVFHKHNCEDVHGTEAGMLDNMTLAQAIVEWINSVLKDGLKPNKQAFCEYCQPELEE